MEVESNKKKKVILLGIDGATFKIIDPLIERGLLPNFQRMKCEGMYADLISNIHPITPSAWASISTGLNPGRHGVYDFRRLNRKDYSLNFVNGDSRRGQAIWEILTKAGKKVCIVNVPLTYPPRAVNGIMISGMDAPPNAEVFTYPRGFSEELKKNIPDYIIDLDGQADTLDKYLAQTVQMFDARIKLFGYLLETKKEMDFLYFVFVEADRLQHVLWKYIDPNCNAYNSEKAPGYRNLVEKVYKRIDDLIGEYYFSKPANQILAIVSDHGFGVLEKDIYLNKWLEEIGLLKFKNQSHFQGISFLENIDWDHTYAYSYGFFGNININLKNREGSGIVIRGKHEQEIKKRIITEVEKLRDSETGEKVVDKVFHRKELYHGPYMFISPDIILIMKEYAYTSRDGYESFTGRIFEEPMKYHKGCVPHSGIHRLEGIFMLHGENVLSCHIPKMVLCDVMPTILDLLDLKEKVDCDGRGALLTSK